MLTMLLGGLWHGAAWTFVAWGAIHGAALAVHKALGGGRRHEEREGRADSPTGPRGDGMPMSLLGELMTILRSLGGWVVTMAIVLVA